MRVRVFFRDFFGLGVFGLGVFGTDSSEGFPFFISLCESPKLVPPEIIELNLLAQSFPVKSNFVEIILNQPNFFPNFTVSSDGISIKITSKQSLNWCKINQRQTLMKSNRLTFHLNRVMNFCVR